MPVERLKIKRFMPPFVARLLERGSQRFVESKPKLSEQSLSQSAISSKASLDTNTNSQEFGVKSLEARMEEARKFRPDRVPCGGQIFRLDGKAFCVACDVLHDLN